HNNYNDHSRPTPTPAYNTPPIDQPLYERIAACERTSTYTHVIPPLSSHAWRRFWASRTRQLHRAHLTTFDRLWSNLPYLRPMATIVADSLGDRGVKRVHDLLGTRCDPYVNKLLTGLDYDYHCHSNLVRAVLPYGLNEQDVHDVINVFQVTGLDEEERYYMEPSPAKPGDYLDLFAEQDLLCALSTCPGGDLSTWGWAGEGEAGEKVNSSDCCRPIKVEVFKMNDEVDILKDWKGAGEPGHGYRGFHGIRTKELDVARRVVERNTN
ncbi:hypothetical protein BDQ17DRAFT_1356962, partial [Cyathus striatus]